MIYKTRNGGSGFSFFQRLCDIVTKKRFLLLYSIPMKTITKAQLTAALFGLSLLIAGCSARTEAQGRKDSGRDAAASEVSERTGSLASFGFHIFPEPIDLPEFSVQNRDGSMLASTELTGTVTLLNFWATWCPPCRAEMPSIERLQKEMLGHDFSITAISVGERRDTVEKFIADNGYTFPVYLDERNQLGRTFASQGIPTTYVVNKQGKIIAGIVGSIEYDEPELVKIFQELSAQ